MIQTIKNPTASLSGRHEAHSDPILINWGWIPSILTQQNSTTLTKQIANQNGRKMDHPFRSNHSLLESGFASILKQHNSAKLSDQIAKQMAENGLLQIQSLITGEWIYQHIEAT